MRMLKQALRTVILAVALGAGVVVAPAYATPVEQARQIVDALDVARIEQFAARLGVEDNELTDSVINPGDYQCSAATPVRTWLAEQIASWTPLDRAYADLGQQLAVLDAVLFPAGDKFGLNGEYTQDVTKVFRDLKKFWDIDGSSIKVASLNSTVLLSQPRLSRLLQVLYGLPPQAVDPTAAALVTIYDQPQFDQGRHPFFSFNAFAQQGGLEIPGVGVIPDEILMGDGVLAGFAAVGLADVSAKAIFAHEYGHHVQFRRNLFESDLTGPEATRRTELMADAFGSYYLTHARGATMQWKRVRLFEQVFFQLGDCGFAAASHHGTPNQRLRAVDWGYDVADSAHKQGHVLPTLTFADLFDRKLPELVAPDA
ncbi:hypothetical protein LWC34_43730 [Kibdelosporangium philippinense]|uniref:Uncharacterized protein n=1 Tax=Kibdelosporangium philippinense TaxID=211113 RepID=A0ABS8ZPL5_9PSEU|nr:hypothetical protein [Kibdelosporangium philippinense]MCE7009674.1 hypothetical protein [Kibdelosporangium philippinense]